MAFQITEEKQYNVNTTVKPKFRVFDLNGNAILLSSATFRLIDKKRKDLVDSGSAPINNTDTDAAGVTIQTVQPTLDFSTTDIDLGEYWLVIRVVLTNGESDVFRQLIEVVDFEDPGG